MWYLKLIECQWDKASIKLTSKMFIYFLQLFDPLPLQWYHLTLFTKIRLIAYIMITALSKLLKQVSWILVIEIKLILESVSSFRKGHILYLLAGYIMWTQYPLYFQFLISLSWVLNDLMVAVLIWEMNSIIVSIIKVLPILFFYSLWKMYLNLYQLNASDVNLVLTWMSMGSSFYFS